MRIDGDDMVVSYGGEHKDRMIENCYGKQKPKITVEDVIGI